jgi:threonine aldolase
VSGNRLIDLRSDTVTRPTTAMREAMARASVGDDVYGDDPTVNAVEARVAELAGKEAAMLVPSGTQGNLVSLLTHCQRGEEYIVGMKYHSYWYEAGGGAVLGGIQPQPVPVQADGTLALADIESVIKPEDTHFARTRLLALENTQYGRVMPLDFIEGAARLAREHGLAVHLDGARLFNAAVASDMTLKDLAWTADTVSLCFSKGLGTPMGSMVAGPAEWIQQARRWRKMVGGGLRQAGVIAAAIDHALDHHVERLADDHRRAEALAAGLEAMPGVHGVEQRTNMVYVDVGAPAIADALSDALHAEGILITSARPIRLVTHLDVDDAGIRATLDSMGRHLPAVTQ